MDRLFESILPHRNDTTIVPDAPLCRMRLQRTEHTTSGPGRHLWLVADSAAGAWPRSTPTSRASPGTLVEFAHAYGARARHDHQIFVDLFRTGQLPGL